MTSTLRSARGVAGMSDVTLKAAIARGSEAALAEAYDRHGAGVRSIARRLCGNVRADDVAQEIFLDLWRRPERFDPGRGSLGAFLSMQAHGRAIDMLRSDGARRSRERADHRRETLPSASPEADAMTQSDADQVDGALALLPALEREVVVLAYYGSHTYKVVAKMLGLPEGTVKSRIRAGLGRLRVLLDDGGPLPEG